MKNVELEKDIIKICHLDRISIMKKFPSGKLISASFNIIKIWNNNLELLYTIEIPFQICISYISIENEYSFAICLDENIIQIYNFKNEKWICVEEIIGRKNHTIKNKIIITTNSTIYVSSYSGLIEIFEKINITKKHQETCVLKNPSLLNTMLLIQDKNLLITSGETCTLFWDIQVCKFICKFNQVFCFSNKAIERINDDSIIIGGKKFYILSISKQNVIKIIENDNCYCNDILNLYDLKNNFLIIANRNSEIKVIKNNRIIQDIKNAQNDSIYGIIQINNETIASYSMWTIQLWKIKK